MKIMLDTNVFDRIAATSGLVELINRKSKTGAIELLTTPVQETELGRIVDRRKRKQLQSIERRVVPVPDDAAVDALAPSPKHRPDAMIGAAAQAGVDYLVTQDSRFARRVQEAGAAYKVLDFAAFLSLMLTAS